jgi:hypothetical protein
MPHKVFFNILERKTVPVWRADNGGYSLEFPVWEQEKTYGIL